MRSTRIGLSRVTSLITRSGSPGTCCPPQPRALDHASASRRATVMTPRLSTFIEEPSHGPQRALGAAGALRRRARMGAGARRRGRAERVGAGARLELPGHLLGPAPESRLPDVPEERLPPVPGGAV